LVFAFRSKILKEIVIPGTRCSSITTMPTPSSAPENALAIEVAQNAVFAGF
jgi:hypothetical protein